MKTGWIVAIVGAVLVVVYLLIQASQNAANALNPSISQSNQNSAGLASTIGLAVGGASALSQISDNLGFDTSDDTDDDDD